MATPSTLWIDLMPKVDVKVGAVIQLSAQLTDSLTAIGIGGKTINWLVTVNGVPSTSPLLSTVTATNGWTFNSFTTSEVGVHQFWVEFAGDVSYNSSSSGIITVDVASAGPPCSSYLTQAECEVAGCYWWGNSCHATPQPVPTLYLDASPKVPSQIGTVIQLNAQLVDPATAVGISTKTINWFLTIDGAPTPLVNPTTVTNATGWSFNAFTTSQAGSHQFWVEFSGDAQYTAQTSVPITIAITEGPPLNIDVGGPYTATSTNPTVQFQGLASNGTPPYTFTWDFGDGQGSNLQSPLHIYPSVEATYIVTLTVTDSLNATMTATTQVTIIAPSPCFIATAAYGSPLAQQLNVLRQFRDDCLPKTLTSIYYHVSPPFAQLLQKHLRTRIAVRHFIDFIISVLKRLKIVGGERQNQWSGYILTESTLKTHRAE